MATINAAAFANHAALTVGLLRNGDAANVVRTARAASIPPKYYFAGVRWRAALAGDPAIFAPACPAAVILDAQIRSAFGTIVEAVVAEGAVAAGAAAFDAGAARAAAIADAGNRILAIGLGAGHAALVASFRVVQADLNATEAGAATLTLVAPANAANEAALAALNRTVTAGWTIGFASNHAEIGFTDLERVMFEMPALSAVEAELAFLVMALGQAAPVRAGAQLLNDGHHYLSDANSSRRHRAIEAEVMARGSTDTRNLWRANMERIQSVVWHAAPHCVSVPLLETWAMDEDMPARLVAAGFGSMAIGLPATEDLFKRAGSYLAVLNQVKVLILSQGHTVTLDKLQTAVTTLQALPRRGALPAERPALPAPIGGAAPWPAGCNTRDKALKLFLVPFLDEAEPVAAWLFGFYKEVCQRAGVRESSAEGSLLKSHSLRRAGMTHVSEANRALEMYTAYSRHLRAEAEKGNFVTYTANF